MFDDMMPHLLVKWLDSGRSLHKFLILLMSPFAAERVCCYMPNDILSMLHQRTDGVMLICVSMVLKARVKLLMRES